MSRSSFPTISPYALLNATVTALRSMLRTPVPGFLSNLAVGSSGSSSSSSKCLFILPLSLLCSLSLSLSCCAPLWSAAVAGPHRLLTTHHSGGDLSISLSFSHPPVPLEHTHRTCCVRGWINVRGKSQRRRGEGREELRKSLIQHLLTHMTVWCCAVSGGQRSSCS